MGKITVTLDDNVENELRAVTRRKGDMSRIVTEALQLWMEKHESNA